MSDTPEDVKKRLDEITELMNARIAEEEAVLKSMDLGVESWIKTGTDLELGYSKETGEWGLHVRSGGPTGRVWRLVRASRKLRLHGLKHTGRLRQAILFDATDLAKRIERFLTGENDGPDKEEMD